MNNTEKTTLIIALNIILILYILIIILTLNKHIFVNKYILPKNIFTYWHSDDIDPIVKINIDNWKRKLPDWTIHVITMSNIDEYVNKSYYTKFNNIIPQHFADHIRLYLLEKYGGVWMDGSILIVKPEVLNNIYNECIESKRDVVLFEYSKRSVNKHPYLENWFIMAPQNSKLIKVWKKKFDECYFDGFKICRHKILKCGVNIEQTIKNSNYLMMHAVMNCIYLKNKFNIKILQASESIFYIQDMLKWNDDKVVDYILSDKIDELDNIYMIKYTGETRKAFHKRINDYEEKIKNI
jgi:hypothetical protein